MTELLLSGRALLVYEILIILVLAFILLKQKKKHREVQERREISNAKMRNLQLEQKLKNPDSKTDWSKNPNPFEIQYIPETNRQPELVSDIQIEIEVHTGVSIQRYLFDLDEEITIGRSQKNILPLNDQMAPERSCSVFRKKRSVYVRNENIHNPVCIQRGKRKQLVQNEIVKLQSKDILIVGKNALHILLYEN